MRLTKLLTRGRHAAAATPIWGARVVRNRVFASVAASVIAVSSATTAGAAITGVEDPTPEEQVASDIVADGISADYKWENVSTMESILPVKETATDTTEKSEPAEVPEEEEEEEEPAEDTSSDDSSGSTVDIAADCSEYSGNKAIGCTMTLEAGWDMNEVSCLVSLWDRESGWNESAYNSGSGAYGIPQSLPGDKMAANGDDWETNPATQIAWGLDYIDGRYGNPCGAWAHSESNGWY
ncbi:hypothetical protein [Glycomyces buryatensis]|uniref:aggregation-promoting factor C-terminal-like domain-containing protein n=1 Tax=Glycomyces buryatensis TaxID=2570927 RepID=UPI001B3C14B9|nr:hypothetical protein [Glycomyces buryatensis]